MSIGSIQSGYAMARVYGGNMASDAVTQSPVVPSGLSTQNSDRVTISYAGKLASVSEVQPSTASAGFKDRMFTAVENDPDFAKEMVDDFGLQTDQMVFALPADPKDEQAWADINQQQEAFNQQAEAVHSQRTTLCNTMRAQGSSDADIFKAVISFNQNLPMSYRSQCGMTGELYS